MARYGSSLGNYQPSEHRTKGEKQMPFKVIDAKGRAPGRSHSTASEVSYYGKTAQFRLTPAAVEALGNPEKVEVLYDEETREIGFRASDATHAATLRKDTPEALSRYFGFRAFAEMIGLPEDGRATITLAPHATEEGVIAGIVPEAS
jgi:hypothetical protein